MNRVRVKICGITRLQDAQAAIACGVDALGFVFFEKSSRYVEPQAAADIIRSLPPFVTTVGLFVNAEPSAVRAIISGSGVNLAQYHGDESDEFCKAQGIPYLKALRVKPDTDIGAWMKAYEGASGFLLDTFTEDGFGGTGRVFDWTLVQHQTERPIILAGGLNSDNVGEAIRIAQPYGVDVSGGVEASRGRKDPQKIRDFISSVARGYQND